MFSTDWRSSYFTARYGLPRFLVSDNGPQFTSDEFDDFCKGQNINHIKVTPYHPKSNGLAERCVRTFKERMDASGMNLDFKTRVNKFLFSYRNSIHKSTGRTPSELMFGRRARTIFDQLKPDPLVNMENAQWKQKLYHDKKAKFQEFSENDNVWVNKPGLLNKGSVPGKVLKQTGPYSYIVDVKGVYKRKHADQLRPNYTDDENPNVPQAMETDSKELIMPSLDESGENFHSAKQENNFVTEKEAIGGVKDLLSLPRRNPPRQRRIPARFSDL